MLYKTKESLYTLPVSRHNEKTITLSTDSFYKASPASLPCLAILWLFSRLLYFLLGFTELFHFCLGISIVFFLLDLASHTFVRYRSSTLLMRCPKTLLTLSTLVISTLYFHFFSFLHFF